jgi:hypothetical protein
MDASNEPAASLSWLWGFFQCYRMPGECSPPHYHLIRCLRAPNASSWSKPTRQRPTPTSIAGVDYLDLSVHTKAGSPLCQAPKPNPGGVHFFVIDPLTP